MQQVKNNFDIFIKEFSKPNYQQIIIEDGEFLENALIKNKMI